MQAAIPVNCLRKKALSFPVCGNVGGIRIGETAMLGIKATLVERHRQANVGGGEQRQNRRVVLGLTLELEETRLEVGIVALQHGNVDLVGGIAGEENPLL